MQSIQVIIATVLAAIGIRLRVSTGQGGSEGRWFRLTLGSGAGYMNRMWTSRNKGPGNATSGKQQRRVRSIPCGHRAPYHCNSAYCNQWFCKTFPNLPLVRHLTHGHTLRIWLGPTYNRKSLESWKRTRRYIKGSRVFGPGIVSWSGPRGCDP
jgi:hypothetical protein